MTSKSRRSHNQDNLKIKTTSKSRRPQNQTIHTKPNLSNQTYQTKFIKPNLLIQTYQTKPSKPPTEVSENKFNKDTKRARLVEAIPELGPAQPQLVSRIKRDIEI